MHRYLTIPCKSMICVNHYVNHAIKVLDMIDVNLFFDNGTSASRKFCALPFVGSTIEIDKEDYIVTAVHFPEPAEAVNLSLNKKRVVNSEPEYILMSVSIR